MKNNLRIFLMIAALGVIFAGARNSFAQVAPIVGGYGSAKIDEKEVVAAANFAVKTEAKKQGAKIKLVSINSAQKQVVAGLNQRLCLSVEIFERRKKTAVPQTVQTVVYQNLKNKYSLTSWAKSDCKP